MIIDQAKVKKIAHLARLEFNEEETVAIQKDMNQILDWMDKLNELDTDDVNPLTHMSAELNIFREDITSVTISHEEALKNAPKKDSDYFKVPKVIDIVE